ncbi:hypothetical protein F4814DRAFT_406953 [Daldinia grandis]|nr:hypothetical protein F4814DRAFT_406953 [Daldinia grandis]
MLTVNGIPEDYPNKIRIIISNKDFNVAVRAYIILTYLLCHDDVLLATENVIHLWYSAFIPNSLDDWIRGPLHEYILTETNRLRSENGFAPNIMERFFSDTINKLCSTTMTRELADLPGSINLHLAYTDWPYLARYLERDLSWEEARSARNAVVDCESRIDARDRYLSRQPPAERPCHVNFRERGILLPMGRPSHDIVRPNITLFGFSSGINTWLLDDTKGPERRWSRSEFKKTSSGFTNNDIYGKLFYYLRNIIATFHSRMRTLDIEFDIKHDSLAGLEHYAFDRVLLPEEDMHSYVVPSGIKGWPSDFINTHNPSSTIITPCRLFPFEGGKLNTNDNIHEFKDILSRYFDSSAWQGPEPPTLDTVDPKRLQILELAPPPEYLEALFQRNILEYPFRGTWVENGIIKKDENTVVKAWPYAPGVIPTPRATPIPRPLQQASTVEEDGDRLCEDRYPAVCYIEWSW